MSKKGKTSAIFSLDTSCLIHAWRRAYPIRHFPPFWERLDELIDAGRSQNGGKWRMG